MDINSAIAALDNPTRRQILIWLKDRSNFPPPLPGHEDVPGVCVGYIQEKAALSQSTISSYMAMLKKVGFVRSERHGQWTFYRRDEDAISAFAAALSTELGA
ncbi:MAG: transcriptional regulator [Pseudomonadota bacterium]